MPYLKVFIHFVWATKNREHLLSKEMRKKLFLHIRQNAENKSIMIDFINGYTDHVHCLVSLSSTQTICSVMQTVKGESAHWVNKNKLCPVIFEWQDEYFAASVSYSGIDTVREYIKNQEQHHQRKTFEQEYEAFMNRLEFKRYTG